jgi:hypothetical protein
MKILLGLCILTTTFFVSAQAGFHTGNGGGLAEANMAYAWENFSLIKKSLIGQLAARLTPHQRENRPLAFRPWDPGLFPTLPGGRASRFAPPMSINLDELYEEGETGPRAMTIPECFLLTMDVLAAPLDDEREFGELKAQVLAAFGEKMARKDLAQYGRPHLALESYDLPHRPFFLLDDQGRTDVTLVFQQALECPDARALKVELYAFDMGYFDEARRQQEVEFRGSITYACGADEFASAMAVRAVLQIANQFGEVVTSSWYQSPMNSARFLYTSVVFELSGITSLEDKDTAL